jgi:uncharacterized protein YyaL (SSP411 family)
LERAQTLQDACEAFFLDRTTGGFFFTASDHEALVVRSKQAYESSIPSGNAVAIRCELELAALCGNEVRRSIAEQGLKLFRLQMEQTGVAMCAMLEALEMHLSDPREIVLTGSGGDETLAAMRQAVLKRFPAHDVLLVATEQTHAVLAKRTALLQGREVGEKVQAYVCRRGVCQRPVGTVAELLELLK